MDAEHRLSNRTCQLAEQDWETYENCPPITKDVLDDQQLDESVLKLQQDCNDSNSLLPVFQPDEHINLHYVRVYYCGAQENKPTTRVAERPQLMQWRGEHFKCRVGFSLDGSIPKSNWTIGLAQACDQMTLKNSFGEGGCYSWEFQPLKSGLHTMVNDSNGSQWPFYSHKASMLDIQFSVPIKPGFHELKFADYFYPTMCWNVDSGGITFPLTSVTRRQSFKVWFLLIKRGTGHAKDGVYTRYTQFRPKLDELHILKAMQWNYAIDMKFDVHQPLGSRCVSIIDKQEKPSVLESVAPIPTSALVPPCCNLCQSLIFYPTNVKHPLVLKNTPDDVVVPWPDWCKSMGCGQYRQLVGFQQPVPPPTLFPCFPGDPRLSMKLPVLRVTPMEAPPEKQQLQDQNQKETV